jgi:hypothetical protein
MDWNCLAEPAPAPGIIAPGAENVYLVIHDHHKGSVTGVRLTRYRARPNSAAYEVAQQAMCNVIVFPLGRGPGRPAGDPELAALVESAKVYAERYEAGESLAGYPAWQHDTVPAAQSFGILAELVERMRVDLPPATAHWSWTVHPVTPTADYTLPKHRRMLAYGCPRCHAEPGRGCRTADDLPTASVHTARQDLYLQAAVVLVDAEEAPSHEAHTVDGPADCRRCNFLRENQDWMDV